MVSQVGQGQWVHFSHWHRSTTNIKIYKRLPHIGALALTISDYIKIKMFDPPKLGQDHGVQLSHWQHSMANVKIYKSLPHIFAMALTVSEI